MNTGPDCIACFMSQALRTGRLLGLDEQELTSLMLETGNLFASFDLNHAPPRNARKLYDLINRYAGTEDPFRKLKDTATNHALALYPELKKRIQGSDDPIGLAIRLSIAGNVIDFGVASDYDLEKEIEEVIPGGSSSTRWEEEKLKEAIKKAEWILYLADNTGESVMDRLLIEALDIPVKYAVKSGPIINDVEKRDALSAGLNTVAEIVETGCRIPGIALEECSENFMELFETAPLIISKGQGNFETLAGTTHPVFFLLKAKCRVVAKMLGVNEGELIITPWTTKALDV